jgi:hypothetical protein
MSFLHILKKMECFGNWIGLHPRKQRQRGIQQRSLEKIIAITELHQKLLIMKKH